jgi:hypothetical protein
MYIFKSCDSSVITGVGSGLEDGFDSSPHVEIRSGAHTASYPKVMGREALSPIYLHGLVLN